MDLIGYRQRPTTRPTAVDAECDMAQSPAPQTRLRRRQVVVPGPRAGSTLPGSQLLKVSRPPSLNTHSGRTLIREWILHMFSGLLKLFPLE